MPIHYLLLNSYVLHSNSTPQYLGTLTTPLNNSTLLKYTQQNNTTTSSCLQRLKHHKYRRRHTLERKNICPLRHSSTLPRVQTNKAKPHYLYSPTVKPTGLQISLSRKDTVPKDMVIRPNFLLSGNSSPFEKQPAAFPEYTRTSQP